MVTRSPYFWKKVDCPTESSRSISPRANSSRPNFSPSVRIIGCLRSSIGRPRMTVRRSEFSSPELFSSIWRKKPVSFCRRIYESRAPLVRGRAGADVRGSYRGWQSALFHSQWLSASYHRYFLPRRMVPLLQHATERSAFGRAEAARAGLRDRVPEYRPTRNPLFEPESSGYPLHLALRQSPRGSERIPCGIPLGRCDDREAETIRGRPRGH